MTTPEAAAQYLGEHLRRWNDKGWAVHNPDGVPVESLPVIYGFNNGGSADWLSGCLITASGVWTGGHVWSHEGYMPADLGVLLGSRPDRHDEFRKLYPRGYRMEFVSYMDVPGHTGLQAAFALAVKAAETMGDHP